MTEVLEGSLRETVRKAHRGCPTCVTVVTVLDGGVPYGLAVNAFMSLSLDPPSLAWAVKYTSRTHDRLVQAETVGISILAHDQEAIANVFASSADEKFTPAMWTVGRHGAPLIVGAASAFEVTITARTPCSSHTLFTGRVLAATESSKPALLYVNGTLLDAASATVYRDADD
jgi:flavin reductase (DIM6/NTAB) family NADH-FMN oxidoreductase RutF